MVETDFAPPPVLRPATQEAMAQRREMRKWELQVLRRISKFQFLGTLKELPKSSIDKLTNAIESLLDSYKKLREIPRPKGVQFKETVWKQDEEGSLEAAQLKEEPLERRKPKRNRISDDDKAWLTDIHSRERDPDIERFPCPEPPFAKSVVRVSAILDDWRKLTLVLPELASTNWMANHREVLKYGNFMEQTGASELETGENREIGQYVIARDHTSGWYPVDSPIAYFRGEIEEVSESKEEMTVRFHDFFMVLKVNAEFVFPMPKKFAEAPWCGVLCRALRFTLPRQLGPTPREKTLPERFKTHYEWNNEMNREVTVEMRVLRRDSDDEGTLVVEMKRTDYDYGFHGPVWVAPSD